MEEVKVTIGMDAGPAERELAGLQGNVHRTEQVVKGLTGTVQVSGEDIEKVIAAISSSTKSGSDQVTKKLDEVVRELGKVREASNQTRDANKEHTVSINDMTGAVSALPGPVGQAASAFSNLTSVVRKFIGSPLLWFLAAAAAAYQYLTWSLNRTVEGQEKLDLATAKYQQRLENVKDAASTFGRAIYSALDGAAGVADKLLGKLGGIGRILGSLGGSALGPLGSVAGGMLGGWTWNRNVGEAVALQQRENELWQKRKAFKTEEAQLEQRIAEARARAYDDTLSAAEQEAAVETAVAATNELYDKRREIAEETRDIAVGRLGLSDSDRDAEMAAEQAKADVINLETQRQNALRFLNRMTTRLNNQDASDARAAAKAAEDALEQRDALFRQQLAQAEAQTRQHRTAVDAATEARIAAIEDAGERERAEQKHQHEVKLRQIEEQSEAYRKANYEAARKAYEAANPGKKYSETDEGGRGWQVVALTNDQRSEIEARVKEENAIYARGVAERYQGELQAMRDYLKEYGTIEEQRFAITQEYEEKMKKAETPTGRASVKLERDKALKDFDARQREETMDWAGIFSELKGHTQEYLMGLRDQLLGVLRDGSLMPEQMAVVQEKIRDINDEISKQNGLFQFQGDRAREHARLVQEAADAQELLTKAKEDEVEAQTSVLSATDEIRALLDLSGIDHDVDIDDELANVFDAGSEEYKLMAQLIEKLRVAEGKLAKSRKETEKATKNARNAEDAKRRDASQAVADWFEDAQQFIKDKGIGQIPGMLEELGLGDASEKAAQGLAGFNDAAGAAADFASQNYIGALMKGLSAIKNFAGMLGIGGDSDPELEKDIEKLTASNKALQYSIDELAGKIQDVTAEEATSIYKKQKEELDRAEKNTKEMMYRSAMAYSNGVFGIGGSSSGRYFIDSDLSQGNVAWQWISDLLGKDVRSASQFFTLTSEEMYKVATELPEVWARIQRLAAEGYKDASQYMDEYIDYAKQREELENSYLEKMTSVSFDSIPDDFASALMDMDTDAESFAGNFEEYMKRAVVNAMIVDQYKPLLEEWYRAFANFAETGGKLDEQEIDMLRNGGGYTDDEGIFHTIKGFKQMSAEALALRDNLFAAMGWTKDAEADISDLVSAMKSAFGDMEDGAEAWAESMKRYMADALANALVYNDPNYQLWLEDWSKRIRDVIDDETLTREQQAAQLALLRDEGAAEYEQWARRIAAANEMAGLSTDELLVSFDDLFSSIMDAVTSSDTSVEEWARQFRVKLARSFVEAAIFTDEAMEELRQAGERISQAIADGLDPEEIQQEFDIIEGYITQGKTLYDGLTESWGLATADASSSFSNLRDNILDALMDIENGTENFVKRMRETLTRDILNRVVLELPVDVDWDGDGAEDTTYNNYEAWQEAWLERYAKAVEEGNTKAMGTLAGEAMRVEKALEEAAKEYTDGLKEIAKDTTFTDMEDSFVSALMDMEGDVEDFANDLKKTIVQKLVEGFMVSERIKPLLEDLQKTFDYAMSLEGHDEQQRAKIINEGYAERNDDGTYTLHIGLEDVTDELGPMQQAIRSILESIGYEFNSTGDDAQKAFDDLGDTILSSLMDTTSGVEGFMHTVSETIARELTQGYMATEEFEQGLKGVKEDLQTAIQSVADAEKAVSEAETPEELAAANEQLRYANQQLDDAKRNANDFYEEAEAGTRAYTAVLKELAEDTTFRDMTDSWVSSLMDFDATAEDWAQQIGRTMAQKIIEQMVAPTLISPLLQNVQKAFNDAMAAATTTAADGNATYDWDAVLGNSSLAAALADMQAKYPELKEVIQRIMELAGIKPEVSNSLSSLSDVLRDRLLMLDSTVEDIGKQLGGTLIEEMLDQMLATGPYADEIAAIQQMWQDILDGKNVDENGNVLYTMEDVLGRIAALENNIADNPAMDALIEKWKELNEEVTDVFSSLRSSLVSSLMDMEATTADFASDIGKIMTEAMIDKFVLGKAFDDKLAQWQERYKAIAEDAGMSEGERAAALSALKREVAEYREQRAEEAKQWQDLMGTSEYADQDATVNMADKATYDQFELYLGIAMAQQIAMEQGNAVREQILVTLRGMSGLTSPEGEEIGEIRQLLHTGNEYLWDIKESNARILSEFGQHLTDIKARLYNI